MKGYALGQAIDRIGPLGVACSLLAWIAGVLSRPRVLAALVAFVAAGVWMNGGLPETHWPQWAQLPQWPQKKFQFHVTHESETPAFQEESTRKAMEALSQPASPPLRPDPTKPTPDYGGNAQAPSYKAGDRAIMDRLIDNTR